MFQNEGGMDEVERRNVDRLPCQVRAVKFDVREARGDRLEIGLVNVEAGDAVGDLGVDAVQTVSAGDAEDGDGSRAGMGKRELKQLGQRRKLLDAGRRPVAFLVGQGDAEPWSGHQFPSSAWMTSAAV